MKLNIGIDHERTTIISNHQQRNKVFGVWTVSEFGYRKNQVLIQNPMQSKVNEF